MERFNPSFFFYLIFVMQTPKRGLNFCYQHETHPISVTFINGMWLNFVKVKQKKRGYQKNSHAGDDVVTQTTRQRRCAQDKQSRKKKECCTCLCSTPYTHTHIIPLPVWCLLTFIASLLHCAYHHAKLIMRALVCGKFFMWFTLIIMVRGYQNTLARCKCLTDWLTGQAWPANSNNIIKMTGHSH